MCQMTTLAICPQFSPGGELRILQRECSTGAGAGAGAVPAKARADAGASVSLAVGLGEKDAGGGSTSFFFRGNRVKWDVLCLAHPCLCQAVYVSALGSSSSAVPLHRTSQIPTHLCCTGGPGHLPISRSAGGRAQLADPTGLCHIPL